MALKSFVPAEGKPVHWDVTTSTNLLSDCLDLQLVFSLVKLVT